MAGVYFELDALEALMEHHIGIVNRYGFEKEEHFSVVALACKDLLQSSIKNAMQKILRESDAIISDGDYYYLILPSTKKEGAYTLAENIFEYLGKGVKFKVFSYPNDGVDSTQIVEKLLGFKKDS